MAVQTENLLMGPVEVYAGLTGAVEPTTADVAPGVGWTDLGGTDGGVVWTLGQTYTPMMVDQIAMAAGARKTDETITVATSLAEATLDNLRRVRNDLEAVATEYEFGGDLITNSDPNYSAILLRGSAPAGGPRLVVIRRTLSTEAIGIPFQKTEKTVFPVTWTAYYVSASVPAVRVDDTVTP